MEKKNVPKIRFPGFTEPWEQRKLCEVAEIVSGGTPSTTNKEYWDGDIDWYTPAEINNQIYVEGSERKITELGLKKSSAKILPAHKTVLFTSRAGIGKMAILYKPGTTNQGFQSIVLNNNTDSYFVYSMGSNIKEKAEKVASGSTFAEISGKALGNLKFMFPNEEEQVKIGAFFKQLDNLISLHHRKLENLKKQKKGLLQKMFPEKGKKVPEIRFPEFTNDWEQRKLGELSKSFEYGLNASAKEFDGENKYIRITDIDEESHNFMTDDLTSPNINLSNAGNYKLSRGDILFARTGASVGKSYIYKESDGIVYYAGFLIRARIKEEVNPEFVFQNTLTKDYEKYISVTSQRSGQPGVNAQEYAEYKIMVPNKEEQDKISDYMRKFDNLISLHQRKLEHLQKQKKALLQQMFV